MPTVSTSSAAGVPVPFHDPSRSVAAQHDALLAAVASVFTSGRYILGPEVEAFEHEFSAWVGDRPVIGVANGTDALEIALRAGGVGPDTEVVTVANAGGYTSAACRSIGATPVYVDVDQTCLLIDPAQVAAAVTPRTAAVVVTHLYGQLANVAAVRRAVGHGVTVIEDCAQAHGAGSTTSRAGTLGDLATFSFYPTKNLGAIGDAGAVVAEAGRAELVRQLRTYGWASKYRVEVDGGRNSRLDELQAALLRVRLASLADGNRRRTEIAAAYRAAAPQLRFVGNLHDNVHHLCVIAFSDRDAARQQLAALGIGTDVHYPVPDHHQPAWSGGNPVVLPVTERAVGEILSVPCFPELTDVEVDTVASALAQLRG